MDLVLFGIQGSGKGTQAKKLADEFGYYIFEAGGELRKMAASGTELGNTVKEYIDNGHLVPFEIIMQVVKEAVTAAPADQPLLFDGIPRDHEQMTAFNDIMIATGRDFQAIQILLDKAEAMARIAERAQEQGRADDADIAKVERRIDLFFDKTMPVIDHYKQADKLTEVAGDGSIDEVYSRIKTAIDS